MPGAFVSSTLRKKSLQLETEHSRDRPAAGINYIQAFIAQCSMSMVPPEIGDMSSLWLRPCFWPGPTDPGSNRGVLSVQVHMMLLSNQLGNGCQSVRKWMPVSQV